MKRNIGVTDAIARMIIGLVIAALGVYFQSWWGLLAVLPIVTSVTGNCPLYRIIGINTCKRS